MFKDDDIERGRTIGSILVESIREAKASIVLLSKNYASSVWCLSELLEILKCRKALGQIVMPIFDEVTPSDVRRQKGDFGIAFEQTCEGATEEQKRKWIKPLTRVASIAGEHSGHWRDEAAMLEKISADILNKLKVKKTKEKIRIHDIDQNDFITASELRYVMTKYGGKVTNEEVLKIIKEADGDDDGRISYI